MNIRVQNISKNFERFPALNDVSVKVRQGDLLALLGPSGSGKTTLLRIIAGLEFPHPNDGKVLFDDKDVTWSSAYERRAGFVFQHYALFNHLTVAENIAFGLRVRPRKTRPPESEIQKRITVLLEMVQLPGLEKRFPAQLSGGQRQRIALARALAVEPKILLLDEPFGALDAKVRKDLRKWLREFHDQTGLTTIFVTHDQEEAFELADHVTILHQGKIQQSGTPKEILARPANAFVTDFLDLPNSKKASS
ncbi:MAG: sulfate ABC transporter ATP-binding protein [Verrucomicrobia bacterium]|nr:sulfate ABC transporter ATP-binding protein [Verrucomicrobiota bacterium]